MIYIVKGNINKLLNFVTFGMWYIHIESKIIVKEIAYHSLHPRCLCQNEGIIQAYNKFIIYIKKAINYTFSAFNGPVWGIGWRIR